MGLKLSSLILGLVFAGLALVFQVLIHRDPELWKRLPRERVLGGVLALVCLAWASGYVLELLEGSLARFAGLVRLGVPVLAVLSFFAVEFLFTRALGTLFMLMAVHLLDKGFEAALPGRQLYSALCLLVGIVGMVLVGQPWRFRDLLESAASRVTLRRGAVVVCALLALFFAAFPLLS
jgi:hypothetical protein